MVEYRVARHVVDYLLLTTKYEIPMFPLGSRAATVSAHQPAEHKNKLSTKARSTRCRATRYTLDYHPMGMPAWEEGGIDSFGVHREMSEEGGEGARRRPRQVSLCSSANSLRRPPSPRF